MQYEKVYSAKKLETWIAGNVCRERDVEARRLAMLYFIKMTKQNIRKKNFLRKMVLRVSPLQHQETRMFGQRGFRQSISKLQ